MALDPRLALIPGASLDTGAAVKGFQNALLSLRGEDPDTLARKQAQANIAATIAGTAGTEAGTANTQAQTTERNQLNRLRSVAMFATDLESDIQGGDLAAVRSKTKKRIENLMSSGQNPDDSVELLAMLDNPAIPDAQKMQQVAQLADKAKADAIRFKVIDKPESRSFQFGSTLTVRDSDGNEFSQTQRRDPSTGNIESVLTPIGSAPAQPVGGIEVVGSSGETPAERVQREASAAERTGNIARRTKAVEVAVKKGADAFDRIEPVQTAIQNYDDAIAAIDQGAETGVIKSKLPSFKDASIKLDNTVKRLGLDVVGNTTFGALSESELKFALSAAIPTNLSPPELREWLVAKRNAQRKVKARVEEAAKFLSSGDKTIKDWIELDQAKQLNLSGGEGGAAPASAASAPGPAQPSRFKILSVE